MENDHNGIEDAVQRHLCGDCGADMVFDPGKGKLSCPYCGGEKAIESRPEEIVERDIQSYLRPPEDRLRPMAKGAMQVACDSCGATVTFVPPETATECDFCAAKIVAQPKSADPLVAPEGVLPFSVEKKQAAAALREWTATRWFAPNRLKTMARHDKATSIYIPYWTYDADSETDYTGQRGINYQETQTYRDSEGNTKTRTVTRTNWYPASGHVSRHFDDIYVPATTSVLPKYLSRLKWDFSGLASYDPAYLSGHKAQTYQVSLEEGFGKFQEIADGVIRGDVRSDIGGDRQRIGTLNTVFSAVTFKHLLVPVYAGAYKFNNKVFQIIVNGRTGEVYGERPYSVFKIGCLVLAILAAVVFVIILIGLFNSVN